MKSKPRNKDNKITATEINRKVALFKRIRNHRSQKITEVKRKSWGL